MIIEVKHLGDALPEWLAALRSDAVRFSKFAEGMARLDGARLRRGGEGIETCSSISRASTAAGRRLSRTCWQSGCGDAGYKVTHAREGGELRAPIARRLRELTRDLNCLEMSPRTEFLLNLARDAQQLEEVIKPALQKGQVCISDRYLYSQLALSGGGRGLPHAELEPALKLASQGIWPDLVILVDVDPGAGAAAQARGEARGRAA